MARKLESEARPDRWETMLSILLEIIIGIVVLFVLCFPLALIYECEENMPSISVESMSVTVVGIASDSQVKANLEVVFGPVENTNMNTIIYSQLSAMAFHLDKLGMRNNGYPLYENKKLVQKVTVAAASFKQQGGNKTTVAVRMEDVTVDLDEYEQRIYDRYGVSYLMFELVGFIEMMQDGSCLHTGYQNATSRMTAESEVLKVVFPLFQWNQTNKFDFQPPKKCSVHGDDWRSTGTHHYSF